MIDFIVNGIFWVLVEGGQLCVGISIIIMVLASTLAFAGLWKLTEPIK